MLEKAKESATGALAALGQARTRVVAQPTAARVADALRDRAIPFLFVSGYGRESLPVDFNDIPILQKPFDHEQLVHCVDSLMDNR